MAEVEEEAPAMDEPVVEEEEEEDVVEEEAVAEEEDEYVAVGGATEVKLFGKWSFDDIEVRDISLVVRRVARMLIVRRNVVRLPRAECSWITDSFLFVLR